MSSGPTPPPPSPSVLSPAAPVQPGARPRRRLVWIVVAAFLGVLLLVVLFIGAIAAAVLGSMRSSEPYRFAMQTATHDPRVLSRLGSPVKAGLWVNGTINIRNDSGDADLSIPVQGPLHKGTIHIVAKKSEGEWTYQRLTLKVESGSERLDLLVPASAAPREE